MCSVQDGRGSKARFVRVLTAYLINANLIEEGASVILQLGLVDLWLAAILQTG